MDALKVIAVVAIVCYVIGRQFVGEPLRAKRLVVLPAALTVIGIVDLAKETRHLAAVDLACLIISGVLASGIGLAQGRMMRLSARDGYLWGKMPAVSLWLWVGLIGTRVVMMLVASGLGAEVAASTTPMLAMLGLNRLGQAAAIVPRALATGVPFAPEQNGRSIFNGQSVGDK